MNLTRILRVLSIAVLAAALTACASRPATTQSSATPVKSQEPVATPEATAPEQHLRLAHQALQSGDSILATTYLLSAVEDYLAAGDSNNARQILLTLREQGVPNQLQGEANLLTVLAYLHDPSVKPGELLALTEGEQLQGKWQQKQMQVLRQLYLTTNQWLAAANTQIVLAGDDPDAVASVWEWVNQATDDARRQAQQQYPLLRPYLTLYGLLEKNGKNTASVEQALNQFKQVFRGHPLVDVLPALITDPATVTPPRIDELAVLLPLSGRYEDTGLVVKDGILAGYYQQLQSNNTDALPVIRFIDTQGKDAAALMSEIGDTRYLLGPLLKETLDVLLPVLPVQVNMLALNRTQELPVMDNGALVEGNRIFFSLAPEDEAYQLADLVFSKGYRAPVVVASDSNLYQRMNSAFAERWATLSARTTGERVNLTSVTFSDSASLREGITQALDVAQSNERINQIRYMINEEVYNMARNRQDIDAVVVFASPQHTELLNPMIEASLLPANNARVPVYATSRSIDYDSGKNQWRDLENVRFIEMPWMLPSNPWRPLSEQVSQIWPERLTSARRLFAFGVDAYNLLPYLSNLNAFPQTSVDGLTGTLKLDEDSNIVRRLSDAIIRNETIQASQGD